MLADEVSFATYADRFKIAPTGLFGGEPGACAQTWVERGNERIDLQSKQSFTLRKGDRLVLRTGGGGGYGAPDARAQAALEADRTDALMA